MSQLHEELTKLITKVQRVRGWSYPTVQRRLKGLIPIVDKVKSLDADKLMDGLWKRYKEGIISSSTLNREAAAIKEIGKIQGKDIPFKRLREDSRVVSALTLEEMQMLLNHLHGEHLLLTKLLFYSGARVGEAIKIQGKDLKKDSGGHYIVFRNTKTRDDRVVPVPEEIWNELKEASFGRDGRIFSISYNAYRVALYRAGDKLGFHVHPHMIRHTYATRLVKANINIFTIKDLLGHKDVKITERYVHTDMTDRVKAVSHVFGGNE